MNRWIKNGIGISIFLLLLVGIFNVLLPAYLFADKTLHDLEKKYLSLLEEKTGLGVSYKSLSPSLFTGIKIKGIVVYEVETGEQILTIRSIQADYSLRKVLKKDWEKVLTRLTLNDVVFEVKKEQYKNLFARFSSKKELGEAKEISQAKETTGASVNAAEKQEKSETDALFDTAILDTVNRYLFLIPFAVRINNCAAHYSDANNDITIGIRSVDLDKQQDGSALSIDTRGSVLARLGALGGKTAGGTFRGKGKIVSGISGSSLILSVGSHPTSDYTVYDADFLVRYSEPLIVVRTTDISRPYSLIASLNAATSDVSVKLSTSNLAPFSLVRIPPLTGILSDVKGSRITVNAEAGFNIPTRRYTWQANGGVSLSRSLTPDGQKIGFNASGNNTDIRISSLTAEGKMVGASMYGTFNIPRLEPTAVLSVDHFLLPTGGLVSGDVYIDPTTRGGISAFIPQLFLNDVAISAVQAEVDYNLNKKSLDFSLSLSDYSHTDYDTPGEISVTGNASYAKGFDVQARLGIDSFFIDTMARAAGAAAGPSVDAAVAKALPFLEPFITSTECYVSTDLKSLTFNIPYLIAANTQEERQFIFFSADGTDSLVQVSQLDLLYNGISVAASANADLDLKEKQVLFSTALDVNSIPYQLSGIYAFGKWLNVTGDYDLNVLVNFIDPLNGSVRFTELPVAISNYLLSLTADASFLLSAEEGPQVSVQNLSVEEISGNLSLSPALSLSGWGNGEGLVIDSISYSDVTSDLLGNGYALWSLQEGILDTLTFNLGLSNTSSQEAVSLTGSVTNPLRKGFSSEALLSDYYFSAEANVTAFSFSRFLQGQKPDDGLTGSVSASGTVRDPYISLSIDRLSMQVGGSPLTAHGSAAFVEGNLTIPSIKAAWNFVNVDDISGYFNLSDFTGAFTINTEADTAGYHIEAPLVLSIEKPYIEEDSSIIPDRFTVHLDSDLIKTSLPIDDFPLHFVVDKTKDSVAVASDAYFGLTGLYEFENGGLFLGIEKNKPIHFSLVGNLKSESLDLSLSDLYVDVVHFASLFNSDKFSLYNGALYGNVAITGYTSDPYFDGSVHLRNLDFNSPSFISDHVTTQDFTILFNRKVIEIPEASFAIRDSYLVLTAEAVLDRLSVASAKAAVANRVKDIPLNVDVSVFGLEGRTGIDLAVNYEGSSVDVTGSVTLHDAEITVLEDLGDLSSATSGESQTVAVKKTESVEAAPLSFDINVDVSLVFGLKVNITLPVLRALVAPQTPVHFTMDTANGLWTLDGDVALRGGEVFWLNRNFYLKEGRVVLNENQGFMDPVLSLRAEIRERTETGENVTITLSALQQRLSQFNPILSSNPAKSENEIMALFGRAISGDSSNLGDIATVVGDFAAQTVMVRKIEKALRDLFNFDIFSVRTTLLQNAIRQGISGNSSNNSSSIGNYFDNTTVYIGKYYGSDIYADALLHWSYDEDMALEDDGVLAGLLFQPEIGIEFAAPFANIRWQFAPDLGQLQSSWVPATSLTLSWQLSF